MALASGDKLGPYEIVESIGKGGMGEVYRARDSRLNRDVAVKVSAERFSERFEREARAIAALNHPNICQIYDVGPNYLVMELVEGERPDGPLELDEALRVMTQIAEALAEAHDKGIVHRDLKPGNIKVKADGTVKVLDFGLAKVTQTEVRATAAEDSPTLSMAATQAGVILGTAAYMPPEQAKGKQVDRRADVWAFGVVFYELLTGKKLFQGDDVTDTLAAVVMKEPDLTAVPARVRPVIEACLRKDPKKRLQAIGDWRLLVVEEKASGLGARPTARLGWPIATVFATAAAVALGYFAYRHYTEPPARLLTLAMPAPGKSTFNPSDTPAISPDGRHVAFTLSGEPGLWVRDLATGSARQLSPAGGAHLPFWSPDSRTIAFFAESKLKRIDLAGGPEQTVADAPIGNGGAWGPDNVILFTPAIGPISRVAAAGGTATPVTKADRAQIVHLAPAFLPDGRFLYSAFGALPETTGVFLADLNGGPARRILPEQTTAIYAAPGYLLFQRAGSLMAQRFDVAKGDVIGDAVPVAESVGGNNQYGLYSASQQGTLVYAIGGGATLQLTWLDQSGKPTGTVGSPGGIEWGFLSPDEKSVVDSRGSVLSDVWLHDLEHGTTSKLTFSAGGSSFPVWSPDGSRVAYAAIRGGGSQIAQKAVSGPAQEEILDSDARVKRPTDWSPDGRYLIEESPDDPKTGVDVWLLPLKAEKPEDRKAIPFLKESYNEGGARVSPDGKYLAYMSDENKRLEIYVSTFPEKGGKWQISANGGMLPIWSRDGKRLYFVSPDGRMMAAEIRASAGFEWNTPQPLFPSPLTAPNTWFDVSKDGRFLMSLPAGGQNSGPLMVIVNWQEKLKR